MYVIRSYLCYKFSYFNSKTHFICKEILSAQQTTLSKWRERNILVFHIGTSDSMINDRVI